MDTLANLRQHWIKRCQHDFATQLSATESEIIVTWLLGWDMNNWQSGDRQRWELQEKGLVYRYQLLQRYLPLKPSTRYGALLKRLRNMIVLRQKIKTWIALSRDRRRTVLDVIEEVVQEMLQRDRHLQQEMQWIQQCSPRKNLQEALLCTALEEYCLRPVHNQPLITYRFINFLRRCQRGGITQLPMSQNLRLLSAELEDTTGESTFSLLDHEAITRHQTKEEDYQQQLLRQQVLTAFVAYLKENVKDPLVVPWLKLYLQGKTPEAIAEELQLPIRKAYRLRDKVRYHAVHNFAIKTQPQLVAQWLKITLQEHRLGLNEQQWQRFKQQLSSEQNKILSKLQDDLPLHQQAEDFSCSSKELLQQWGQIYLLAQQVRSE